MKSGPLNITKLLLLLVIVVMAIGVADGCGSASDCSLNGVCSQGKCVCEPAWMGMDCGELNLLPTQPEAGLNIKSSSTWGGASVVDSQGLYHMYAAFMENHCGLSTWIQNSVISHSVGKTPLGPFTLQSLITAPFAHNPQPSRAPDGTYLIFHIGCSDESPSNLKNCTNGTTPSDISQQVQEAKPKDAYYCNDWSTRALSSTSLAGPWTDHALFAPVSGQSWPVSTDNPSAYYFPNGSVLVMFRSWYVAPDKTAESWIGVATAEHWSGPYKVPTKPIFNVNMEDPFLWRDKTSGYFHALFHSLVPGAVGRHAYSVNGLEWTLSNTPAYNASVKFDDGTSWWAQRRERPQLHFDPNTGRPLVLYNGVQPSSNDRTYTLATPIFSG